MSASLYKAPADRVVTSTLLDFDGPHEATFVDARTVQFAADPLRAGNRVLVADGETRLSLASLVRGRDFGGMWDVVGVRLWSEAAITCELSLQQGDRPPSTGRVSLTPRTWTTAWIEVAKAPEAPTTLAATSTSTDVLRLTIKPSSKSRLLVDDVAMAQSRVTVSDSKVPKSNERWTVSRAGLQWLAALDGRTFLALPAAPFTPNGYRMAEAGPTRAVFTNDTGSTLSIDRTGRFIQDGVAKLEPSVLKIAKAIAENASPAKIEIVGDEGRVERSLPGDRDNDGYDELRGCYTVHAVGGRAAVRFTRQGATVKWPVLEVLDLPSGTISVWLDGELVPWAVRGSDGRVIVELPIELQTPVEVQVRVK